MDDDEEEEDWARAPAAFNVWSAAAAASSSARLAGFPSWAGFFLSGNEGATPRNLLGRGGRRTDGPPPFLRGHYFRLESLPPPGKVLGGGWLLPIISS